MLLSLWVLKARGKIHVLFALLISGLFAACFWFALALINAIQFSK